MKKYLFYFLALPLAVSLLTSCGKDDDDEEEKKSSQTVVINEDGTTSNGMEFSAHGDKSFYLDHIMYTVVEDHLEVTGYEKTVLRGVAKIVGSIKFNGITYKVQTIGKSAFMSCTKITGVEIPNSVTSIGERAFDNCSDLSSLPIPNSVTSIGRYAFNNCSSLTSVTIPESVTSFGTSAFEGCYDLASVKISEGVTEIGRSAFYNCSSLKKVTIPISVTDIGYGAFFGCEALEEVHCLWETPLQSDLHIVNSSTAESATLYVPKGTKEAYKATSPWSVFDNIEEE